MAVTIEQVRKDVQIIFDKYKYDPQEDFIPSRSPFWSYLPPDMNGAQAPEVEEFIDDIENIFCIYLTDGEWEKLRTLDDLSQTAHYKILNRRSIIKSLQTEIKREIKKLQLVLLGGNSVTAIATMFLVHFRMDIGPPMALAGMILVSAFIYGKFHPRLKLMRSRLIKIERQVTGKSTTTPKSQGRQGNTLSSRNPSNSRRSKKL